MVSTPTLTPSPARPGRAVGAKVVAVGDHHQLDAVGAAARFRLLADTDAAVHLAALWRFTHRWEAQATRALRAGDPAALDAYAAHDRLHGGAGEVMADRAYAAVAADRSAGRAAVLLAADRATVAALNRRAHDDRIAAGLVRPDGIALADDTTAGVGDVVVTRRNDRRLTTADGGHVRNGALWQITAAHPDGSLQVSSLPGSQSDAQPAGGPVALPADYVREHVELGYATTVHRAQGMTVEVGHVLAGPGLTRQQLYVAMTRGREANHVYVACDGIDPNCPQPHGEPVPTARQVLEKVLAHDGGELSATETLRRRYTEAASPARLLPIRDTLTAAAERGDAAAAHTAAQVRGLLRARAARHDERRLPDTDPSPVHPTREGIHR